MPADDVLHTSELEGLRRLHRGKVRDIYEIDAATMLMVTTDRLSAFDVVLPDPIPGKGRVLNAMSDFWFGLTAALVPNHLTGRPLASVLPDPAVRAPLEGRSCIVRRLRALPIEAVVRGFLAGSGWRDYERSGTLCGIRLPPGLAQAERLPQPLYTPAYKAEAGAHDENVSFEHTVELVGEPVASAIRDTAIALYRFAAAHALSRGIIIADTKFEFGLDTDGRLTLMDEVLTPDSSRFWPADTWRIGTSPPSFDKQYVRDYLETLDWDKAAPGPRLPAEVIRRTSAKYREALARVTGPPTAS